MPPTNKVLELLKGLGVKVNEDTMQIVPDETETPAQAQPAQGIPAEPPPAETPTIPVQAANSVQPAANAQPPAATSPQLTMNELGEIRGYINLLTDFGGPEGFKTILKAMQEVGPVVQNLKANAAAQRSALVAQLHANERCPFSEDELAAMPVEQLTKLNQALSPVNYAGMGGAWQNASGQGSQVAAPKPALLARNEQEGSK